jgi:hypothetical protein
VIDRVLARWSELPVSAVTACGLRLERDGTGPNAPTRARRVGATSDVLAALQRVLPEVPID